MKAYYMDFRPPDGAGANRLNKIGGCPELSPTAKPWGMEDEKYLGFSAQLQVDGRRINIPSVSLIQLYQSLDDGDDPTPLVALVEFGAASGKSDIPTHPHAKETLIFFREEEDPDQVENFSIDDKTVELFRSKVGGYDPWSAPAHGEFLAQLNEAECGLNFGGCLCSLYRLTNDEIVAVLR